MLSRSSPSACLQPTMPSQPAYSSPCFEERSRRRAKPAEHTGNASLELKDEQRREPRVALNLRDMNIPAAVVRNSLGLLPHPEGGCYRELWRDRPSSGERGAGTSILFLLAEGERSLWHRVDAAEIWLWQAGAPLLFGLHSRETGGQQLRLGPALGDGDRLQAVVPAHTWQEARSVGAWSLVSCVVAPAFEFAGFEVAPADWSPSSG